MAGLILEVRDAWCPRHGRVRPELASFPFTMDADVLERLTPICGAAGCEDSIELDAVEVAAPAARHYYVHVDGPDGHLPGFPRLALHLTPDESGRLATGRMAIGDAPSGAAPA